PVSEPESVAAGQGPLNVQTVRLGPVSSGQSVRSRERSDLPVYPLACFAMGFLTVSDARFVQVDGRRLLVRRYDPDTDDVVALWPSDVSEYPSAPGTSSQHRYRSGTTQTSTCRKMTRAPGRPGDLAQSFPRA